MSFYGYSSSHSSSSLDARLDALKRQMYRDTSVSRQSTNEYQTAAYYTALCNSSQGYGYGNRCNTSSMNNRGVYHNASWSSDYLI